MIDFSAINGTRANDPTNQSKAQVDKQAFLKLLVTQLRSQDPFEPLKNEEFLAQLAQFSQLESLNNIYDQMNTNNMLQSSVNSALSTSLIGNYGVMAGNTVSVSGNSQTHVLYSMKSPGSATITIRNSAGDVVRTIENGSVDAGDHAVNWDGLDDSGNRVSDGDYTVTVEVTAGPEAGNNADVYRVGRIRSVRFFGGTPVVVIDNKEFLLGDVLEVTEELPGAEEDPLPEA